MKKILLLFISLVWLTSAINAQFNSSKLTFGGGLGLQFGDYTLINISPQVGYNITNFLNVGAGISYIHYSEKYDHDFYKQKNNYLGLNIYSRIYPIPYIVLMVQPEINRMWRTIENRTTHHKVKDDELIPVCLVGGGVRLGPITAMIQYDVVQNNNSPYGNRLFYSVGYTFGF